MAKKITIAKALTLKNKLVRKLTLAQNEFASLNNVREDLVDVEEWRKEATQAWNNVSVAMINLVILKSLIANTSAGGQETIMADVIELGEAKSFLAFLNRINPKEQVEEVFDYNLKENKTRKYLSWISKETLANAKKDFENKIEELEDKIRWWNSNNYVEFDMPD